MNSPEEKQVMKRHTFPPLWSCEHPNKFVSAELRAAGIEPLETLDVRITSDGFRPSGRHVVDGIINGWRFRRDRDHWVVRGAKPPIREALPPSVRFVGVDTGVASYVVETAHGLRAFVKAVTPAPRLPTKQDSTLAVLTMLPFLNSLAILSNVRPLAPLAPLAESCMPGLSGIVAAALFGMVELEVVK